ncbi:MAG TPA: LysR family transcriptional regulator [Candidatus Korarchaeota archaeon]|nr:LysR family transcriptional regulator [Candidatus Korarchaeota archaeon]
MRNPLEEVRPKVALVLEYRGEVILDPKLAKILEEVERRGSLLAACKAVGASYSRVWEKLSDLEKILGERVLEVRRGGRGGGGARLKPLGKALLKRYMEEKSKLERRRLELVGRMREVPPDFLVAGSHDPALEAILERVKSSKPELDIERVWLGSAGGLAALMLEQADAAGSHLLDPETGMYNVSYLSRYWLDGKVVVIRGYQREIGLVYRPDTKIESLKDLLAGKFRLINRNPGSGTRILLDYLLRQQALDLGIDPHEAPKRVKGYQTEVRTHVGIAKKVASGEADVGVAVRFVAEKFGLGFKRLAWEWYDLIVRKQSLKKQAAQELIRIMTSGELAEILANMPGYRITEETGYVMYS